MIKIKIKKSKKADTRSCDYAKVTKNQLEESSVQHINDVRLGFEFFKRLMSSAAYYHDIDKLDDMDMFHRDFITGFEVTEWWDKHRKISRHHLLQEDGIPKDVNLIDVLEMIIDCTMAGMGRTEIVYPLKLDPEVLMKAFENTCELLKDQIVVEE